MGTFQWRKPPGIASRPPPFVTCSLSSGGICGARGLFPHHPLILVWFYSPALRLSACLGPSVIKLEMYKVELILQHHLARDTHCEMAAQAAPSLETCSTARSL